jgi:hypothetical protein
MGGGTPIIMGGTTNDQLTAQLERAALENERMLTQAADEAARLQSDLESKDKEMSVLLQQQQSSIEQDLAEAQKALNVEIDEQRSVNEEDDLEQDFGLLEQALTQGLGTSNVGPRPK